MFAFEQGSGRAKQEQDRERRGDAKGEGAGELREGKPNGDEKSVARPDGGEDEERDAGDQALRRGSTFSTRPLAQRIITEPSSLPK